MSTMKRIFGGDRTSLSVCRVPDVLHSRRTGTIYQQFAATIIFLVAISPSTPSHSAMALGPVAPRESEHRGRRTIASRAPRSASSMACWLVWRCPCGARVLVGGCLLGTCWA